MSLYDEWRIVARRSIIKHYCHMTHVSHTTTVWNYYFTAWLLCESITLLPDYHTNLLLYCMTNARHSSGSDGTPYITKLLHDHFVKFLLYCVNTLWNYSFTAWLPCEIFCFTAWASCEMPILLPYGFSTWLYDYRVEGTHAAVMGRWRQYVAFLQDPFLIDCVPHM